MFANLVSATAELLSDRFGKRIKVDPLPPEFTEDNLARWESEFNLKPIFLPDEKINENRKLNNWIKLGECFYQKINQNEIALDSVQLYRAWYLADFTQSVDYTDGSQVFPNDPFISIISELRELGRVGKHDNTPEGSRFSIAFWEWQGIVCPAIARKLSFKSGHVRLERALEFNAIGNIYDSNRGRFNTWEWFYDKSKTPDRLRGGRSKEGGLSDTFLWLTNRSDSVAGRPLVSFAR